MRCKACDSELGEYEIIWRKDLNCFEDLCKRCRNLVHSVLTEYDEEAKINNKLPQQDVVYIEDQLEINTNIYLQEEDNYEQ